MSLGSTGLRLLVFLTLARALLAKKCKDPCPPLSCTSHEYTQMGECCPQCCEPGVEYQPDRCTHCTCGTGDEVSCLGTPCTVPSNCPHTIWVKDDCGCPQCPPCRNGDTFVVDACTTCECKKSKFTCKTEKCTNPNCDGNTTTVWPFNKCCPVCKSDCSWVPCKEPPCQTSIQIVPEGEFCAICMPKTVTVCPNVSSSSNIENCRPWEASYACGPTNSTDCTDAVCVKPDCPRFMWYTPEGNCCPRCRIIDCEVVMPSLKCSPVLWFWEANACHPRCPTNNVKRRKRADYYSDCSDVMCRDISGQCPQSEWVFPEDHCCPVCQRSHCSYTDCPMPTCPSAQNKLLLGANCPSCVSPQDDRCAMRTCMSPYCPTSSFLWLDGACCPTCPQSDCGLTICPALDCHPYFQTTLSGQCCPICRIVDCTEIRCALLECTHEEWIFEDSACCPRRKDSDCTDVFCNEPCCDESEWIFGLQPLGQTLCCAQCSLKFKCKSVVCPEPPCPQWLQYTAPGECCKQCLKHICSPSYCSLPSIPRTYWQWSPGNNCPTGFPPGPGDKDDGDDCPTPPCAEWLRYVPPGEVCEECRVGFCTFCWRPDCPFNEWIWEPWACCPRCPDWSCDKIQCRIPQGCFQEQWIQVPGHCCPQCPEYSVFCWDDAALPCLWPGCPPWEWIHPKPWLNPPECCAECPPPGLDLPFKCSGTICPELTCQKSTQVIPLDECCPVCPTDDCSGIICPPVLNCPTWLQFVPEGACCPKCRVDHCFWCPSMECQFEDWIWEPNACCPRSPDRLCKDVMCSNPTCPPSDWVHIEDPEHCCPVCPEYQEVCEDSPDLLCSWPNCAPYQWNGFDVNDQCCPTCRPSLPVLPIQCPEGLCPDVECPDADQSTPDGDCCPHCDGDLDCSDTFCPTPQCVKFLQFTPEGHCCPVCRTLSTCVRCPVMTCPFIDWIWEPGACCQRCPEWDCKGVMCHTPTCPKDFWMFLPGHCCPVCPTYGIMCYNSPELLCSWPPCAPWTWEMDAEDCCPHCPQQWLPFDCATVPCNKPDCAPSQQYTQEGECCPQCRTIDCSLVRCAKPDCDEPWVKEPGECCPRCPRHHVDCTKIFCTLQTCPMDQVDKYSDQCCPTCLPTLTHKCSNESRCTSPMCPERTWIYEPGACCPRCPVSDSFDVECLQPKCDRSEWIKLPEECCLRCPTTPTAFTAVELVHTDCSGVLCKKPHCSVDRYQVAAGGCCADCSDDPVPLPVDDQDDPCECVLCVLPEDCENNGGELVIPPGNCCPICIMALAPPECPKLSCAHSVWRNDDLTWCPWCPPCIPGEIIDTTEPCLPKICLPDGTIGTIIIDCLCYMFPDHEDCQCPGLAVPEGECCPQCPETDCLNVYCPALPCPKELQETLDGECCPRCKTCQPGKTISLAPCLVCECGADGQYDCHGIECNDTKCDDPNVLVSDLACCPVCAECVPGMEVPNPNPCNQTCSCNTEGRRECVEFDPNCTCGSVLDCKCEGLAIPEGECCPVCPDIDCYESEMIYSCEEDDDCPGALLIKEPNACCERCLSETDPLCSQTKCPGQAECSTIYGLDRSGGRCCPVCKCTYGRSFQYNSCIVCDCEFSFERGLYLNCYCMQEYYCGSYERCPL